MALTFDQIIEKYRENSTSERDKGDKFERLMQAYLLTKPTYKSLLTDVWLWSEFPYKDQFGTGGKDTGIDLVCRTHDGEYWAVQCKFYRPEAKIDLHLVSTFLLTASYPFDTKDGKKNFSHRIWIDTTYDGFNSEALNAINKGIMPGGGIEYRELPSVKALLNNDDPVFGYQRYIDLLYSTFGEEYLIKNGQPCRDVDRALWVYGHFFKFERV